MPIVPEAIRINYSALKTHVDAHYTLAFLPAKSTTASQVQFLTTSCGPIVMWQPFLQLTRVTFSTLSGLLSMNPWSWPLFPVDSHYSIKWTKNFSLLFQNIVGNLGQPLLWKQRTGRTPPS